MAIENTMAAIRTILKMVRFVIEGHATSATRCLAESPCAPDELTTVLRSHGVVGFVFSPNYQTFLPQGWNVRLVDQLRGYYADQSKFVDEMLEVLRHVKVVLDRAGIECVVLKGALFGQRYYDSRYRRRVRDLDILVHPKQLESCLQQLESIGYSTVEARSYALSGRKRRLDHAACLQNGRRQIDVHWQLRNAAYELNYRQIWTSTERFQWEGSTYRVLSPEYEIAFQLLSIAHDMGRGACRIRHLADAYSLIRHHYGKMAWTDYFCRREREGTAIVCLNVLDLLTRCFDCYDAWPEIRELAGRKTVRIACQSDVDAIRLLTGSHGNAYNRQWFERIYPNWRSRAVRQFLDLNVTRPGRIPWIVIKGIRRLLAA
jgi:hypothetical protein